MSLFKRTALGCLAIVVLIVALGALLVLNRERVVEALDAQAEGARATMFRLGEVMSISAALKEAYGMELDAGYVTSTGSRILRITCKDCDLPAGTTAEAFARGIAVAAIEGTTKIDQIDMVEVVYRFTADEDDPDDRDTYGFSLEDLARD